jgi:hypothetical protein
MALTQYGVVSTNLTATTYNIQPPAGFVVTGFSYASPTVTLTIGTHNFVVGQSIMIQGIVTSSTSVVYGQYTITAVAATTVSINYGATAPGTYTSGGIVRLYSFGDPVSVRYCGGYYFLGTENGCYFYSQDGINWLTGQLPNAGVSNAGFVDIDHDGTTFAVCTTNGDVYTSTTLLSNSWTARLAVAHTFTGIKWLAGSTNRWIVYGGQVASTYPGTNAIAYTATTATGTWTVYSFSGTAITSGFRSLAFDGVQTVALFSNGGPMALSNNATVSFVGYAANVTWQPASIAGQLSLQGNSATKVIYNPTAAKWIGLDMSNNNYSHISTAGSPASPWTKCVVQSFPRQSPYTASSKAISHIDSRNLVTVDVASGKMLFYGMSGGNFIVYGYSLTPTSINSVEEYYPLVSIQTTTQIPSFEYSSNSSNYSSKLYVAGYFNNKWILFCPVSNNYQGSANTYQVTVLQ